MSKQKFIVHARYRNTAEDRETLQFAADLHSRLHNGEQLRILVNSDVDTEALAAQVLGASAPAEQSRRICEVVCKLTGLAACDLSVCYGEPPMSDAFQHVIFVGQQPGGHRRASTLLPYNETSLNGRGTGPVVIPLGAYESGIAAASLGLPLARALGKPVVFWHTTLKKKGLQSDAAPELHMSDGARTVRSWAETEAERLGVTFRTEIVHARLIVEGIVEFASHEGASLIVMSRGEHTTHGSYVDQVLVQTSIPLLIARQQEVTV